MIFHEEKTTVTHGGMDIGSYCKILRHLSFAFLQELSFILEAVG